MFESILVTDGKIIRLAAHLARLDRSCRELYGRGLPDDLAVRVRAAVPAAESDGRRAVRVRVRLDQDQLQVAVETRRLGPRPASSTLRRGDRPTRSWRHKWVDRGGLDAAERGCAPALPYFVSDTRPELISETSRGNLFLLDHSGDWCTPPLDDQILPGVTRREVIDLLGPEVRIRPCPVSALQHARGAFWTSSLSGAVAVTAVDDHLLPDVAELLRAVNDRLGVGGSPD